MSNLTTPLHCWNPDTQQCFHFIPQYSPGLGYFDTFVALLVAAYTASTGVLATYILNYGPSSWQGLLSYENWNLDFLNKEYICESFVPGNCELPTFGSWNELFAAVSILATLSNTLLNFAPHIKRFTKFPTMAGLLGGGGGGGGPLDGVTGAVGGVAGGLPGGDALGGVTDTVGGLTGGLLGGGQGLNLVGLVSLTLS